jgi:hypothetical protein
MTITIPERPGRCRWCGCTHFNPCEGGCWWANRQMTLCSACVVIDRQVRSTKGRRELADLVQEHPR